MSALTTTTSTSQHAGIPHAAYEARCPKCRHLVVSRIFVTGEVLNVYSICYNRRSRCKENGLTLLTIAPVKVLG